jgi:hypothetical protein
MSQSPPPPPGGRRTPGARKEDWIASQLRHVYDEALNEAIPQNMIDLLNALDASDSADGEDK